MIKIETQVSKKIPIPGSDFSSRQASITISAEVSDLNNLQTQARALYAQAEAAVDAQLGISPTTSNRPVATVAPKSAPSQPSRKPPAPISEAQLRYLTQLIKTTHASVDAILHQHQVGALRDLSSKAASALIDEMRKSVAA